MNTVDQLISKYKKYVRTREKYFNYLDKNLTFSQSVLKDTREILFEYNTLFEYEKKGNKREGAFVTKTIRSDIEKIPIKVKKIKIRSGINFILQSSTYFHELTHLINNHNFDYEKNLKLSRPQKEYVAEVTSQALMFSFFGGIEVENYPNNEKWEHSDYIYNWIKNAKFSEEKINEIWKQINFSYNLISKKILQKNFKNS